MTENEFLLEDRLQKIRSVMNQYGEENFALSFSGGKDSTVLSHLIDEALPGNKIPRLYADTGIEYKAIRDFVKSIQEKDNRVYMLKPSQNIRKTLDEHGYPFKSKRHSFLCRVYQRNSDTKSTIAYITTLVGTKKGCPEKLMYQFKDDWKDIKINDYCCKAMKENPLDNWKRINKKPYSIIGVMRDEGGRRETAQCMAFTKGKLRAFQPLAPLTKEWENWYIELRGIKLCDLYYPPYNFERTGCKGCPFAPNLQYELDTMQLYFPAERKQCELIWKPVYDEYRRIGYRLKSKDQFSIYDCEVQK